MNHYLILFVKPVRWGVLHATSPITTDEVRGFLQRGAQDIVNITDPNQPESIVFKDNLFENN